MKNVDYQETFAPTANFTSVRTVVQLAAQNDLTLHQMDVKTAYLNAPIDCEIYMEQPEGFAVPSNSEDVLVCKFNKSLYGLKQSGRNWNGMLQNRIVECKIKFVSVQSWMNLTQLQQKLSPLRIL